MNLNQLVALVFILVILGIGTVGLTVLLDVVFARWVRRASASVAQMPIRSAVVGAINFVFFSVIAFVVFAIAQELDKGSSRELSVILRFWGALIILVLASFVALGIAASARWLGERIAPEKNALRQSITGIVVLELACFAPLVGWIVVPLAAMLVGYGAVIIALVWRRE
ncbi:MAG: hypothetical protein HY741_20520 [Chloroflexi bacterium]|nr:hypothetical protein [Chloroflexota bacterium]